MNSRLLLLLFLIIGLASADAQRKELTVDLIYTNSAFYAKSLSSVKWHNEGKSFSYIKYDPESGSKSLYSQDTESGEESLIVSGAGRKVKDKEGNEEDFSISNYEWAPGERYILFTEKLPARTVKSGGTFYIYDLREKKLFTAAESEQEQVNAEISPDGTKLGFVRGNNLFVVDIQSGEEKKLTFDGSENILNGVFDWVYEEEFSVIKAWEWSPDSKTIAFWQLDQREVPVFPIEVWEGLYPSVYNMKYPKPGEKNSKVKIGAVDIESSNIVWMDLGDEEDIYIPRIKFTAENNILSIQRMNRLQNKLELLFGDIKTGKTKVILTETDEQWVDIYDHLTFLANKEQFIWSSEKDGYLHFYLYNYKGELVNQITSGKFEIDKLGWVDEKGKRLFYTSNERGILYKDVYVVNFDGSGKKRLSEEAGNHSLSMGKGTGFYIDKYSNTSTITVQRLHGPDGKLVRVLAGGDMSGFEDYDLQSVEFFKFKASDGVELNASMIKPTDFDESKKYPVLIYNYGGPGSQSVEDSWDSNNLWHQLLAQKGYIIFTLDNRGTGGRGKDFKDAVYKQLGKLEVNDMVEGAKYLSTLSYVDVDRIGIWGWSYGGYMAALTMTKASDYFKAGIAVAPVTHWKFYDTIYTERFMQTPELNPEGYEESSPITHAANMGGSLLLVHGTGDDNVHFQNSIELSNAFIDNNVQFESMYYPGRDHGISGGMTRQHLFNMMTQFILEKL